MKPPAPLPEALWAELAASQKLGLIGPRSLDDHVHHAEGFGEAAGVVPCRAVDLGPGGGIPALVLAARYPDSQWTLIEARERAAARLDVMVARLGWVDRVSVRWGSAESAGRDPKLRAQFDLATARGFGPPAMTAECAAPLLSIGGRLVVSEPPADAKRWSDTELDVLGLVRCQPSTPGYFVAEQIRTCPEAFPRREGRPRSHPLW